MFLPGVCAGWVAPRALLFRVGVEKMGREPVVWSSPRFFFFLCGADDGSRTRCLHLGMVALYMVSYICVFPRLFEHCQFVCLCVAGVGADDGG